MGFGDMKASKNPTGGKMPLKVKSLVGPAGKQLNSGATTAAGGNAMRKLGGK